MTKLKVFLGGTCAEDKWRESLMPYLLKAGIDFFNPVVVDWNSECQAEEYYQKEEECFVHLYVITKKMYGVFSIAEVIDSVHNKKVRTVLNVVSDGFNEGSLRSLRAVVALVKKRGGHAITTRFLAADFILRACLAGMPRDSE